MKKQVAKKYKHVYLDIIKRLEARDWKISQFGNATKNTHHLIFKNRVVRFENHVQHDDMMIKYRVKSFTYDELNNYLMIYKDLTF